MAIGRVIDTNGVIFPDFDVYEIDFKDTNAFDFILLSQNPNITKIDILEYFEWIYLGLSESGLELDSIFLQRYPYMEFDEILKENNPKPTYGSECINILGQLFLAEYIEFGMCGLQDKEENLLSNQNKDKYQAWIYFRDNFFYKGSYDRDYTDIKRLYKDITPEMYVYSTWDTPEYWDMYRFWVARTPKGTQYFNEILAPRFYNKYKDLEVEIDDKGNIIQWIGKINH